MIDVKHLTIPGILHDISFSVAAGERVGIIGESGSGKSVTALTIMGLSDLPAEGSVTVDGVEMVGTPDRVRRKVRGTKVAIVFQEPMTALDPLKKIGKLVPRPLLADVGVDLPDAYPHELSGGQRQRVLIALALSQDPDILLCDEPTTALDAIVQADILALLDRIVNERGMGLLFISHDLAVVRRVTDRVLVFKYGRIVPGDSDYARELAAASRPGAAAAPVVTGGRAIHLEGVTLSRGGVTAVDDVSLTVSQGERLAIVGGSGSGKTSLLHLIAGLVQPTEGAIRVEGDVQMVFQDPYSSLDPRMEVGRSVRESGVDRQRAEEVLERVGLAGTAGRLPREFSGGQRQRVSIARAAAPRPSILLADEPVSALDVTLQAQVLDLLRDTVGDGTLVFVTHDLRVARELCPTVAVMHRGKIVEHGRTEDIWRDPHHPYTRALLDAVLE